MHVAGTGLGQRVDWGGGVGTGPLPGIWVVVCWHHGWITEWIYRVQAQGPLDHSLCIKWWYILLKRREMTSKECKTTQRHKTIRKGCKITSRRYKTIKKRDKMTTKRNKSILKTICKPAPQEESRSASEYSKKPHPPLSWCSNECMEIIMFHTALSPDQ